MEPILLVHGYSAESTLDTPADVQGIFGSLPDDLVALFREQQTAIDDGPVADASILNVNISRYVSLDDGVSLEDISLAFDRIMNSAAFKPLLTTGFNAIIHSTGALVLRNWIRRYSPKPSPCKRIIHLAGANLGSGWAHIGETQLAKWLRYIGQGGQERGLAVLEGLELGSNWAIDLHTFFLQGGQSMLRDYGVMEFSVVGSQPPPAWMIVPFRYGKEDGSDGVVRVSASNLNHNYLRLGPTVTSSPIAWDRIDWDEAEEFAQRTVAASTRGDLADFPEGSAFAGGYYKLIEASFPGEVPVRVVGGGSVPPEPVRPVVPFAIPYRCAHSTAEMGIVYGTAPHLDVMALIRRALTCMPSDYDGQAAAFAAITAQTYARAESRDHVAGMLELFEDVETGVEKLFGNAKPAVDNYLLSPQAQYDRHAQVVFRVKDQNGKPVKDCSIHFNSFGGDSAGEGAAPKALINSLFEDTHLNNASANTVTFYLRLEAWSADTGAWEDRLLAVNGVDLEIDSIDPLTDEILFLPLRMRLSADRLAQFVKPHETTIIDVTLMRLPSKKTFSLYQNPA